MGVSALSTLRESKDTCWNFICGFLYIIMHPCSTLTDLIYKYSNTAMHKYGLYRGICVVFV